ncbi:MAG: hypothetical protein ABFD04_10335 [Syntrophomonas sp.]
MDYAYWIDWQNTRCEILPKARIYLGEECCEKRLPPPKKVMYWANRLHDQGNTLTFITPFVSDAGLIQVNNILDALSSIYDSYEVVCNDWGVFSLVIGRPSCIPLIGRLLSRQDTDPRLAQILDRPFQESLERDVWHVDGTPVRLKYKPPSEEYKTHLRTPSIINNRVLSYLSKTGSHRLELNNPLQGLKLELIDGWKATIYIPDVIVSIKRHCSTCSISLGSLTPNCCNLSAEWIHPSFPVPLHSCGNALYYLNNVLPDGFEDMGIDRIVLNMRISST